MKLLIPHKTGLSVGLGQLDEEVFITSACCGWTLKLELGVHPAEYRCVCCSSTGAVKYDSDGDILRPVYHLSWAKAPAGTDGFAEWLENWFPELEGCEVQIS